MLFVFRPWGPFSCQGSQLWYNTQASTPTSRPGALAPATRKRRNYGISVGNQIDQTGRTVRAGSAQPGKNYDRCLIRADDINRPALQILGFFDYFAPDRIQVIGKVEWTYLNNQSPEERRKCFDAFLEKPIPP